MTMKNTAIIQSDLIT